MEALYLCFLRDPPVTGEFPHKWSIMRSFNVFDRKSEQVVEETGELREIWDDMMLMWGHFIDNAGDWFAPYVACHKPTEIITCNIIFHWMSLTDLVHSLIN